MCRLTSSFKDCLSRATFHWPTASASTIPAISVHLKRPTMCAKIRMSRACAWRFPYKLELFQKFWKPWKKYECLRKFGNGKNILMNSHINGNGEIFLSTPIFTKTVKIFSQIPKYMETVKIFSRILKLIKTVKIFSRVSKLMETVKVFSGTLKFINTVKLFS